MFGRIGRAISRPVRGAGRIARGVVTGDGDRIRQGFGDIGEGVQAASPALAAIPGVGTLAAAGIGAAGAAANRMGQSGANIGSVLSSAGRGGAGAAAGGVAGRVAGAVPGADRLSGFVSRGAGEGGGGGIGSVLSRAGGGGGGEGGRLSRITDGARRLGGWVRDNPELATDIAGTGLEAYGAHQQGRAMDRDFEFGERQYDESEERRRRNRERIDERRANRPALTRAY